LRYAKENVIRLLVGNKCDLEEKRQVSTEQGKELAKQFGKIMFFETSAKNSINIDGLFNNSTKTYIDSQRIVGKKERAFAKKESICLRTKKRKKM